KCERYTWPRMPVFTIKKQVSAQKKVKEFLMVDGVRRLGKNMSQIMIPINDQCEADNLHVKKSYNYTLQNPLYFSCILITLVSAVAKREWSSLDKEILDTSCPS